MSYDPDDMMLELFRAEVESHSDSLTNSLLKLEQSPEATGVLDGMMRAAHSIKGAARIVRVDAAVDVAHVMEDCFVAAQRGELVLESSGIDVLLKSVDLLVRISEASRAANVDWTIFDPTIKNTVEQLRCVLNKQRLLDSPSMLSTGPKTVRPDTTTPLATLPVVLTPFASTPDDSPLVASIPATSPSVASAPILILPKTLGTENAESFRVHLIELLHEHGIVSLDLSGLQDLDAIGLAWLHSATKFANTKTKQIVLLNVTPNISKLLDFVGLPHSRGA